ALARIRKLEHDCAEYAKLVALLQEANERLQRGLTGHKAERFAPGDSQMSLAILQLALQGGATEESPATSPDAETQTVAEHERRKPVRKPLPDHLPRVAIEFLPEHVKREGLDAFERIGADTREVIERRPASAVVVQLIYPKFVRKDRARNEATEVLVAPTVEMPIERGLAGPTLLADTIVRRWADHQPLSRQEGILAREGLDLAKSTLCGWHETLAELAAPLLATMFVDALSCPYLCVDATGVLVQAPERCKVGHFWVMVAPDKHVLYRFSARHDAKAVDGLLAGYSGYLVADAHAVYDHLYRDGAITEVACWSHGRRYWFKALESDPDRAKLALSLIGELFRIERTIADAPRKKREAVRSTRSKPVVQKFFEWCESQRDEVLDESPVATAIRYALNQRAALSRFLDDGRLPAHNNLSELNLRRQVLGRRNWLFLGSEDGAQANTTFVSLLASARLHDIEPLGYIRDILCLLPSWPRHRVLALAPAYWKKTLEEPETQQKLDANVFRRVTLGLPPLV
ncbi:MAG: IS66 family transposase, partial [Myxococcota bacterium]|nr:IS66 family transposase [Myxococcota bacterium]